MAKKCFKKYSSSLAIRENANQIKSTLWFQLPLSQWQKSVGQLRTNAGWIVQNSEPSLSAGWIATITAIIEISVKNSQQAKINLPYDPDIALLAYAQRFQCP